MAQLKETVLIAPSPNLNQASASSAQPSWRRPTSPPDTIVSVRSSSITDTAGTICTWEERFAELEADIYVARSADGGFTWAAPGPPSNNIGNRNQNIYADKLVVSP